jgi:hypothetical protein
MQPIWSGSLIGHKALPNQCLSHALCGMKAPTWGETLGCAILKPESHPQLKTHISVSGDQGHSQPVAGVMLAHSVVIRKYTESFESFGNNQFFISNTEPWLNFIGNVPHRLISNVTVLAVTEKVSAYTINFYVDVCGGALTPSHPKA